MKWKLKDIYCITAVIGTLKVTLNNSNIIIQLFGSQDIPYKKPQALTFLKYFNVDVNVPCSWLEVRHDNTRCRVFLIFTYTRNFAAVTD